MPSVSMSNNGRHLLGSVIDNGRLELVDILGYGAYGVVYRAVDISRGPASAFSRQYAVKCQIKAGLDTRQRQFQRREIALHQLASKHQNVVTMHRVIEEESYVFVIMDFCEDGDLFGMITEKQRYIGNDYLIKRVFLQIIDAVEYCHSFGIYHRDLKPENILCSNGGADVYLADFGLATSEKMSHDFGCGSTFYMSPECQGGLADRLSQYSTQSNDIWSLGIILVNLTCGRNPWQQARISDDTFRAFLNDPNFLRTILPISKDLNYILSRIFTVDPHVRLTLKELREMIFVIDDFNMSEEELRRAHAAARAAAHSVKVRQQPQQYEYREESIYSEGSSGYQAGSDASSRYPVQVQVHPHQPYSPSFEHPTTPLLFTRSRSSSGDEDSSLPPTPPAPATAGEAIPIADASFELDDGPRVKGNANMNIQAVGKLTAQNNSRNSRMAW